MDQETDWNKHQEWLDSLMDLYPDRPNLKTHKKEIQRFIQHVNQALNH